MIVFSYYRPHLVWGRFWCGLPCLAFGVELVDGGCRDAPSAGGEFDGSFDDSFLAPSAYGGAGDVAGEPIDEFGDKDPVVGLVCGIGVRVGDAHSETLTQKNHRYQGHV